MKTVLQPTLPGCVQGIVGMDPWRVQCQTCGHITENESLFFAIRERAMTFHEWPDGSNPRMCRDCRLARGCDCDPCKRERQGTEYPR